MSDLTNALKQRLAWNKVDHCVRMGKSNYGWDASTVAGAKVEYAHTAPITALLIEAVEALEMFESCTLHTFQSCGCVHNVPKVLSKLREAVK